MKKLKLTLGVLILGASFPAAAGWQLDVGQARVTTDMFAVDAPLFPSVDEVPSFRRELTFVTLGKDFGIGPATFSAGLLWSEADRFRHDYSLGPNLPATFPVEHRVHMLGARAAWSPFIPLGGGWGLDGALGAQWLQRRIDTGQLTGGTETQSDVTPYMGIGVSRRFLRTVGVRAGAEYGEHFQAVTLGVRIGLL